MRRNATLLGLAALVTACPDGDPGFSRYIIDTTRRRSLQPELDSVFVTFDRRPALSGAEKCMRSRPGANDELERWLTTRGIESKTSLPLGCLMATFNLRAVARAPEAAR